MDNNIDNLFNKKINKMDGLPDHVKWNSNKGWKDYQNKYVTRYIKLRKTFIYISSLAAIFTIFFFVFHHINNRNSFVTVFNKTDTVKKISLPDGNKVWLNRNSSIQYFQRIKKNRYEIIVNGEAYIELTKKESKKYIIKAFNTIVLVETLAHFNISAYPKDVNVDIAVSSGAVKIVEANNEKGISLLLTEGNYCSVHKSHNIMFASEINNNNYLAWKTGELTFSHASLESVVEILAKYYHTDIKLENKDIAYCNFTGSFKKRPLGFILNQIQSDLNFKVKTNGNKITITGRGCL